MKKGILLLLFAAFCLGMNAQQENDPYEKNVVLEEFTTENCPNCPAAAKLIGELMEDPEYNKRVVVVAHHAAFGQDFLTTDADLDYRWFYNYNRCYAPGFMFDRYPFFRTPGGKNAKDTPVSTITTLDVLKKYIDERQNVKSHVALQVNGTYDGASNITVNVTGERDAVFTDKESRIWVYLVENNIKSKKQSGADASFVHQHALRQYNKVWGDKMTWNDDKFDFTCTLKIEDDYNKDNLQVIAFVSAFDPDDPADCAIENARAISFETILGIDNAEMDSEVVNTEYYTIDGMKVTPDAEGMYIQKKTFKDGNVETKKVMR